MSQSILKLVTYNVRYFGHPSRGLFSTKRGMSRIAEKLAALSPLADVVCLQEVEATSLRSHFFHSDPDLPKTQAERLSHKLHAELGGRANYTTYYFPAHSYRITEKTSFYTTGLVILVRDGIEVLRHNADGPKDITERPRPNAKLKQTRVVAHVRVRAKNGEVVDVFNTHLSLPRTLAKEFWTEPERMGFGRNQLAEAKRVREFIEKERASDAFVLVGDFNSLPGSPPYKFLLESGLRDAYAEHEKLDVEALKKRPTAGFANLRMRLDHMLAGPGLRFVDFADTCHFDEKKSIFAGLSDHVPIIGRFTLNA